MRRISALSLFAVTLFFGRCLYSMRGVSIYDLPISHAETRSLSTLLCPDGRFTCEKRTLPFPHWEVMSSDRARLCGWLVLSTKLTRVRGYGGPIELLIAFDVKGDVAGLKVRAHQETPVYVHRLFSNTGLSGVVDADSFTGATVSFRALKKTIEICRRRVLRELAGAGDVASGDGMAAPVFSAALFAAFLCVFSSIGFYFVKSGVFRFTALASAAFLASSGVFLSMEALYPLVFNAGVDFVHNSAWLLLAGFALVFTLVRGRLFCGTVCPFGCFQELIGGMAGAHGPEGSRGFRRVKYLLFPLLIILAALLSRPSLFTVDPIFSLFTLDTSAASVVLVCIILVASLVSTRTWCRNFCPLGGLFAACSPDVVVEIDSDVCTRCGRCVAVCPMGALDKDLRVDAPECVLCGACLVACPAGAVSFGSGRTGENGAG